MQFAEYLGSWTAGEGKFAVTVSMFGTGGQGLCGMLSGGENAHVGGTAYAVPRSKSSGEGLTADISTICGAGHKDVYAAEKIAKKISIAVNETVAISAGVHIDHASQEELAILRQNIDLAAELFIREYRR